MVFETSVAYNHGECGRAAHGHSALHARCEYLAEQTGLSVLRFAPRDVGLQNNVAERPGVGGTDVTDDIRLATH